MRNVWLVAVREYLENVRTKAFLIGVVLTPVWMALIFVIPKLATSQDSATKKVVIVDETGELADTVVEKLKPIQSLEVVVRPPEGMWEPDEDGIVPIEELKMRAGAGELFAMVLTRPMLEKRPPKAGEHASFIVGSSRSADDAMRAPMLQGIVNDIVNERILTERGIDPEIASLLQKTSINYQAVDEEGQAKTPAFAIMPIVFMLLLFMGIFGISQMLMSSTLEEKANRVYEVLLSSISPFELMAGKILGICAVGFTLLLIWSGGGLLAASAKGIGSDLVSGGQLGLFLTFYVLGFIMIASLMVAVGSACSTLKEAQNLMAPISVVLTMPIFMSFLIMRDPNGSFATTLSFIPPFTPFVMMARIASVPPPPAWQIWTSIIVLALGTYVAFRLAARVFRVGILLYGQPPSLKQIFRWMRSDA